MRVGRASKAWSPLVSPSRVMVGLALAVLYRRVSRVFTGCDRCRRVSAGSGWLSEAAGGSRERFFFGSCARPCCVLRALGCFSGLWRDSRCLVKLRQRLAGAEEAEKKEKKKKRKNAHLLTSSLTSAFVFPLVWRTARLSSCCKADSPATRPLW